MTRPLRQTIGAHYGWKDWLVQRVTAVVMIVYTLGMLGVALYNGGFDYALWQALFANGAFRIATLLFGLAVLWHAFDAEVDNLRTSSERNPLVFFEGSFRALRPW